MQSNCTNEPGLCIGKIKIPYKKNILKLHNGMDAPDNYQKVASKNSLSHITNQLKYFTCCCINNTLAIYLIAKS